MTTSNSTPSVLIKDLKPGMNNLHLTFIVLDICRPITTKENQVRDFLVIKIVLKEKFHPMFCRR